jgi:hypothetical protein
VRPLDHLGLEGLGQPADADQSTRREDDEADEQQSKYGSQFSVESKGILNGM